MRTLVLALALSALGACDDLGSPVAEAASLTGLAVAGGWLHAAHDDGTVAPLRPVVTR